MADLAGRPTDLCIAIEGLRNAGNLGTILRTAEAVGIDSVILVGLDPDPFDPATVRAAMGSLFAHHFVRTTIDDLAAWARATEIRLVGTSPAGPTDFRDLAYDGGVILIIGGERQGLSPALASRCDALVRIPMVGRADSLNVAVAAGIILYEATRQRLWQSRPGEAARLK